MNRGDVGKQERQSASEVAILKEASDTRTMQRSRNLEWTLKRISRMIVWNTMQYAEQPRDISYEEADAIVAIQMLEMFENQKEKFLAHLPAASNRDRGLTESSEAAPLADGRNQQFSDYMVKWRI